jgi:uncharacterized membrane protein (DUF2068 family)
MIDLARQKRRPRMAAGFIAIIVFKVLKGIAFVILGIAALRLSRSAEMPSAVEIAKFLSVSKENELVHRVADLIRSVTPAQATAAGVASLVIGFVFFVEGGLLAARLWWSTYLTITLTAMGVPLELWEIVHRPDSLRRYLLLAVNVAILIFLWTRRNEFRAEHGLPARPAKRRATG